MVSIFAGSMPAAFILAIILPAVGCTWPPVPESHRTVLPPVLTTSTVNGIETKSGVVRRLIIAGLMSSMLGVRDECRIVRLLPDAVIERGALRRADFVVVEA